MNYKTTNRLLKKGTRRAVFYQVLCAVAILVVIAPASYLYGIMTAGEGVNVSLYDRVFSETVRPEGQSTLPENEVSDALWALGRSPIERATFNGLVIWSTTVAAPRNSWESELAREWKWQGISTQGTPGVVQGVLSLGQNRVALIARASDRPGQIEIFAYEQGEQSNNDSFAAAGLPVPPEHAEVFDYSGSTDTGVALAFRADHRGDLVRYYASMMESAGWRAIPVPSEREGALLYEREGKRVTLRGMESGNYTYVTLVVF